MVYSNELETECEYQPWFVSHYTDGIVAGDTGDTAGCENIERTIHQSLCMLQDHAPLIA